MTKSILAEAIKNVLTSPRLRIEKNKMDIRLLKWGEVNIEFTNTMFRGSCNEECIEAIENRKN